MRQLSRKRAVTIAIVLVAAASLVGAYTRAASAPATTKQSAHVWISTLYTPGTISSGRSLRVNGGIDAKADLSGTVVKLYKREVGQNADTYVGKATVTYNAMTGNAFSGTIPRLKYSCIVTAAWAGNARFFAGRTWMFAGVKPRLAVTAPVATQAKTRLRIEIAPLQPSYYQGMTRPTALADVQCLVDGDWTYFPGELGVESTDGKSWCVFDYFSVPAGTYTIRARFRGTNYNVAFVSKSMDIVVP